MIQLIEAPPRSGKSYFAVNYLCKFTKYDSLYNEYILDPSVLIISNIEGLRINHWNLIECLKKQSLKEFFTIANFEAIMERTQKTRVIIAIDEVHELFPAGMKDQDLYNFFAYHGHIGLDIILMTQSLDATTRMFNPLLEFIVKVTPRSRAVLNNFSYSFVTTKGTFLYSKSLPKKPLVFGAYKSFRKDEHSKPKNAIKHWIIVVVAFFLVAGCLFKTALAVVRGKSESAKVHAVAAQQRLDRLPPGNASGIQAAPPVPTKAGVPLPPPPAFTPISSAGGSASAPVHSASNFVRVIGIAEGDGKRRYLLSDGRMVAYPSRRLVVDQAFPVD